MATTTTTTDPDPVYFPFTGLEKGPSRIASPYPRGQVTFSTPSVAITVAAGGADQAWRINMILPIGYAYVLVEVHLMIQGAIADLAGWDTVFNGEINLTNPVRAIAFDGISLGDTFSTSALDRRVFTFPDLPKDIIISDDGTAQAGFRIGDHTTDDGAMTGIVFGRFLQYDVEQAHHYLVQTPQLIR